MRPKGIVKGVGRSEAHVTFGGGERLGGDTYT